MGSISHNPGYAVPLCSRYIGNATSHIQKRYTHTLYEIDFDSKIKII